MRRGSGGGGGAAVEEAGHLVALTITSKGLTIVCWSTAKNAPSSSLLLWAIASLHLPPPSVLHVRTFSERSILSSPIECNCN